MNLLYRYYKLIFLIISLFLLYWNWNSLYSITSLIFANCVKNMTYYTGDSMEVRRYNEAIFMGEKGDYIAAESLLSPLINNPDLKHADDVYELYGDVQYKLHKSYDIVRVYYNKSLEFGSENLRVERKISLLDEMNTEKTGTGEQSSSSGELNDTEQSDMLDKIKTLQELQDLNGKRGEYVNYENSPIDNEKALLQSSLDALNGEKQVRDW